MDRVGKQQGSLKEKGNKKNNYTHNQEETAEILWIHNEERGLGKINLHIVTAREIEEGRKPTT